MPGVVRVQALLDPRLADSGTDSHSWPHDNSKSPSSVRLSVHGCSSSSSSWWRRAKPSQAELAAGEKVDTMFAHARLASAVILIIQLRLSSAGCARISSINHSQMNQLDKNLALCAKELGERRSSSSFARMRPASFSGALSELLFS